MNIRIARGTFAGNLCETMQILLRDAEAALSPAIRVLPGLINYYAGIDRESSSMVRVSVWDNEAHAEAMALLPEVQAARAEFEQAGVEWEPIVTYEVTWWVQST